MALTTFTFLTAAETEVLNVTRRVPATSSASTANAAARLIYQLGTEVNV